MKKKYLILLFGLLCSSILPAQQTVPVQIPVQMLPVPTDVKGLPPGCTWTATGGAQILITITPGSCTQTPTLPTIKTVSVSGPSSMALGSSATFAALVTGTGAFDTTVSWTASAGTITPTGLFTAPATAGSVTITATSVQDTTKKDTATVTIDTFQIGSQVITLVSTNVRDVPSGNLLGTLAAGVIGTIKAGPQFSNFNWWQVTFDSCTGNAKLLATTPPCTGWVGFDTIAVKPSTGPNVRLSWNAPPSANLLGYNVYRATTTGGPYTLLAPVSPATVTALTDTQVAHGTQYFYCVTSKGDPAIYQTSESVNSNEASATP